MRDVQAAEKGSTVNFEGLQIVGLPQVIYRQAYPLMEQE
jgi:hypothetical protein